MKYQYLDISGSSAGAAQLCDKENYRKHQSL